MIIEDAPAVPEPDMPTMTQTSLPPTSPTTATGVPRLKHLRCPDTRGLHRMAYWEWGDPANPRVVVCIHGVSRQGRDFDTLAAALADECRVVCPDIVGRGRSGRLADPMAYGIPTYVADIVTLVARLDVEAVDLVGTSMGGLVGISLASLADTPVRRLVVNDVGPTLDPVGLARIGTYLGVPVRWNSLAEAAEATWAISQGFGPHSREQWLALTAPQLVADGEGFVPHYDPRIGEPIRAMAPQAAAVAESLLWQAWDRIQGPVLLLRGANSDVLSSATARAMTLRGPRARLVEWDGIGHAPTLVQPDQVKQVRDFLLAA
jgi:pimeloyl-ACP methyl ester carboxylesterase